MTDLLIRSRRVVLADGVRPATVSVRSGEIDSVGGYNESAGAEDLTDMGDLVISPGGVDAHVHVNEPGRTEWEGYKTATAAAAAGGVTSIVDMPLNSIPPTTTVAGFEAKLRAADAKCSVDTAFWGGVVPGNTPELRPMAAMGVRGFKCFLIHSGVDEFPHVTESDLRKAMPEIARLDSVLLVHAEMPGPIEEAGQKLGGHDPRSYATFLASRPRRSEDEAVELMIRLCRETGCRIHIVHHSSADSLPQLRAAKQEGLPITVETCPHYLTFAAEEIPDGETQYKCCPPVRERENRERLWEAIADGTIDMIVSDHSPCTPSLKLQDEGDFMQAWGGISALQFGRPVMWTSMLKRGYSLTDLARLMSERPAALAGLSRKGRIAPGHDADFAIWDPEAEFEVTGDIIRHRHKLTPYSGMKLLGRTEFVFLRGRMIFDGGLEVERGCGKLL